MNKIYAQIVSYSILNHSQPSYKKYVAVKTHHNTQEMGATGSGHFSLSIA